MPWKDYDWERSSSNTTGQAEREGTVGPLVPWMVVGRPADGLRRADDDGGARVVSGAEQKNHLIEAAPFGRLDQM